METIRFSNISFRYPLAENDALKNINLSVNRSLWFYAENQAVERQRSFAI